MRRFRLPHLLFLHPAKLTVVTLLILVVGATFTLFIFESNFAPQVQSLQATSTPIANPVSDTYTNDAYDYSVAIPDGYRLADQLMAVSNGNKTTSTSDFIVVTDLSSHQEQLVAAQIRKLAPQNRLVSAQSVITGNDFTISPVTSDLGWAFAKHFATLAVPGTNIMAVQDMGSDTLDNGQSAVQYSLAIIDDPTMRLDTVFIPISSTLGDKTPAANSIKGFLVQSLEDSSFSDGAFTQFYKSFDLHR